MLGTTSQGQYPGPSGSLYGGRWDLKDEETVWDIQQIDNYYEFNHLSSQFQGIYISSHLTSSISDSKSNIQISFDNGKRHD